MRPLLFSEEQNKVFHDCIDRYGVEDQINQVEEEAIELALAIVKYKRARKKVNPSTIEEISKRKKELIYEIADVIIMTQQCRLMFDDKDIQEAIEFKLFRQRQRLNEKIGNIESNS